MFGVRRFDRVHYLDSGGCAEPPGFVVSVAKSRQLSLERTGCERVLRRQLRRCLPGAVILAGGSGPSRTPGPGFAAELCKSLKSDLFTAAVPVVIVLSDATGPGEQRERTQQNGAIRGLEAGADEVLAASLPEREKHLRLERALERAERDAGIHPLTGLPGSAATDRCLTSKIAAGKSFALCYADLDYFKEFNDRYGYEEGDRAIVLLSIILRDVVRALAPASFVGHIGGDDFVFVVPPEKAARCCDEITRVFDQLAPYQYDSSDRRAGGFLAAGRRGEGQRVPLMRLSIGVASGPPGTFPRPTQAIGLAAKMKRQAKAVPRTAWVSNNCRPVPSPGGHQSKRLP